jgi:hypothetical protein
LTCGALRTGRCLEAFRTGLTLRTRIMRVKSSHAIQFCCCRVLFDSVSLMADDYDIAANVASGRINPIKGRRGIAWFAAPALQSKTERRTKFWDKDVSSNEIEKQAALLRSSFCGGYKCNFRPSEGFVSLFLREPFPVFGSIGCTPGLGCGWVRGLSVFPFTLATPRLSAAGSPSVHTELGQTLSLEALAAR